MNSIAVALPDHYKNQLVRVSSGELEPPKSHVFKHEKWESRNFDGIVESVSPSHTCVMPVGQSVVVKIIMNDEPVTLTPIDTHNPERFTG